MATRRSASRTSGGTAHVLPRERAGASFDVDALTRIITKGKHAALRRFRPLFASNPLFDEEYVSLQLFLETLNVKDAVEKARSAR